MNRCSTVDGCSLLLGASLLILAVSPVNALDYRLPDSADPRLARVLHASGGTAQLYPPGLDGDHSTLQQIPAKQLSLRVLFEMSYPNQNWSDFERLEGAPRWDLLERMGADCATEYIQPCLGLARRLNAGVDQEMFLRGVFSVWAERDPRAAAEEIRRTPADGQAPIVQIVFSAWATSDPSVAAEYVEAMPAGGPRDLAMSSLLRIWANSKPRDAIDWAQRLPENPDTNGDVDVIRMAGRTSFMARFGREHALQIIVYQWFRSDQEKAVAWIGQLQPDALRTRLHRIVSE